MLNHKTPRGNTLRFEKLEDRRLLAIVWANEFETAPGVAPDFDLNYGQHETVARALVNRAIDDWNAVVTDFNYDGDNDPLTDNTYDLKVFAQDLFDPEDGHPRGRATSPVGNANDIPTSATVLMDNDGGGDGWFFDATPEDDAEFTGIANAFQASFVDASTEGQASYNDFYRTILHEIGHAIGLADTSEYAMVLTDLENINGDDYVIPVDDGPDVPLQIFQGANVSAVFLGSHLYEGGVPNEPTTVYLEGDATRTPLTLFSHPDDLMNRGSTVPPAGADQEPTTRQFISDLDVQILADAYGYTVTLPSELASSTTAHVSLDSQTGTLLVQGLPGNNDDSFVIEPSGDDIRVEVNGYEKLVPRSAVQQIILAEYEGTDTRFIDEAFASLVHEVDYVVSSNEDAVDSGTVGDQLIDLDSVVPGNQVTLRAAVQEANANAAAIYVPQGNYQLSLGGTAGASQGDLGRRLRGQVSFLHA